MTLNFPDSPTIGDVYQGWAWDGTSWNYFPNNIINNFSLSTYAPAAKTYHDAVMTDTPYLYWPLAESDTAARIVHDASGNARNGTYGTATQLVNRTLFGLAACPLFGPSSAYYATGSVNISGAFTLEFIFRRDNFLSGQGADINGIVGNLASGSNGVEVRYDGNNSTLTAYIATGSGYDTALSQTFSDDTDYHIVITVDGSGNGTMYKNGSSVDTTTGITSPAWNTTLVVGEAEGRRFQGWAGHLAIYTAALSSTRVLAHYNALVPSSTGSDGDICIDTVSKGIFGPKASGSWPTVQIGSIGP